MGVGESRAQKVSTWTFHAVLAAVQSQVHDFEVCQSGSLPPSQKLKRQPSASLFKASPCDEVIVAEAMLPFSKAWPDSGLQRRLSVLQTAVRRW